ncbi:hypothetical protein ILUMI_18632 [Ignelater luminosus]|uniref:Uncharacterized protein n=1 Tax=Ignelater luminosus TaxID=2038154 RepID=A0A8K0CKX9_IGNLU|nr:hypothetical protein ILUMI_18632 [Ignelater luminosus]
MERNIEDNNVHLIDALVVKDSVTALTALAPKNKGKFKNAGICTRKKCVAGIEKRLPPIHRPSSREEEMWAVKSLPTNWNPISKPSKVVENLIKKRQNQHDNVINSIKAKFETINFDVEAQIRLKAEAIKRDFSELKSETEKHIRTLAVDDDTVQFIVMYHS